MNGHRDRRSTAIHAAASTIVLGAIAALAPTPWYPTDKDTYLLVGQRVIVPDCTELHCFRVLVPAIVEHLPGPSLLKWKAYAVVANAAAAIATGRLALAFGVPLRAAWLATWMSALGFGALYTLFDPHTADPLMFFAGPALTLLLLRDRTRRVAGLSAVGVLAKEFAAAPLWIAAGVAWLDGRRVVMVRTAVAALSVTTLWALFQLTLITVFDYGYGQNAYSTSGLLSGGYLAHWAGILGWRGAASTLLSDYGALYLLVPAGFAVASPDLRHWTLASIPALLAFVYVQQPDRAIWNFHFLFVPLAALAIVRLPLAAACAFVAAYAAANMRVGAQLPFVPPARFGLAASGLLAAAALYLLWRRHRRSATAVAARRRDATLAQHERRRLGWLVAANAIALAGIAVVMADLALHRRAQAASGINKWGYRGPVAPHKYQDETRIVVLGGTWTYAPDLKWDDTFAGALPRFLTQTWRSNHTRRPVSVVNLAAAGDSALAYADTLADYAYLQPDIAVIVAEPSESPDAPVQNWRRQSALFRVTGYYPLIPAALTGSLAAVPLDASSGGNQPVHQQNLPECDRRCQGIVRALDSARRMGCRVIVAVPPARSDVERMRNQMLLTVLSSRQPAGDQVKYLNLTGALDLQDPANTSDGLRLTVRGHELVTEALTNPLLEMMPR